jgi:chemotaxis response regulator CheB
MCFKTDEVERDLRARWLGTRLAARFNTAPSARIGIAFGEADPPSPWHCRYEMRSNCCGLSLHRPRIIHEGRPLSMTKRNIIVVGTSAGGVEALCELNKHLPPNLDASIFVVMHIGSESLLPQVLSRCGNLPAVFAEHEKRYERGCIYCAPANCHLSIKDHKTVLTRGPRENGHRPAIDVLFRSAAREHRSKVVGVVLSGGRDDGSAGLYTIKARGGVAIVQDPAEAMTPDMPENALNMVDVDFCLPVRQIADVLVQLTMARPLISRNPQMEAPLWRIKRLPIVRQANRRVIKFQSPVRNATGRFTK